MQAAGSQSMTYTGSVTATQILSSTGAFTQTESGTIVDVELVSFDIRMAATLPAGHTEFRIKNDADTEHGFVLEGQDLQQKLDSPLQPGQSATLEVDLKPGQYSIYCPVDNHRGMGMQLALTVVAQ
jgi:uncharacterized cupredoxin-like copper-binding protein